MSLEPSEFAAFFAAVNNGNSPFDWQRRLFDFLLENGRWPDAINAPTGTGKSNVVDVHIFANALRGWGVDVRLPRRMAVVVNRRGLVDAHEERAQQIIEKLAAAAPDSVLGRAAVGLGRLRRQAEDGANVVLARIRGGTALDSTWLDDPTACAVICATPDMWGSRLLFHGYGTSRLARPREAGILAFDSVMILDEAHLNEQLHLTATRTSELLARYPVPASPLQVVSTTATQETADAIVIGVDDADVEDDSPLADRLTAPKPVTYAASPNWHPKRIVDKYIDDIVDAVVAMTEYPELNGTIGCVVNRVETAVKVAAKLEGRVKGRDREKVLSWVGPMRRLDLRRYEDEYEGVFTPAGNAKVGVVVATQTIEVGVNVDFAGMVTELAPGVALAQRAGRVNRLGRRKAGPVVVVGPEAPPTEDALPYSADELAAAHEWVLKRLETPEGLSPWAIHGTPPQPARRRRDVFSRLESGDVYALAPTSEIRPARPELDLWLHDSLESDTPLCGIVLRGGLPRDGGRPLPADSLDALAVLRATPPDPVEVFPTPVYRALKICAALRENPHSHSRAFRSRDGAVDVVDVLDPKTDSPDIAPGDVLILDADHDIVLANTIVDYGQGKPEPYTVWGRFDSGDLRVRLVWRDDSPSLFAELDNIERSVVEADDGDEVADLADRQQEVLADHGYSGYQLTVGSPFASDDEPTIPWIVLRPNEFVRDNEETRQTWTGRGAVLLHDHAKSVAARAREIAEEVGLPAHLQLVLEFAGLHHDDGKRDPRFQRMLGGTQSVPLAKSGGSSSRRTTTAKTRTGLPPGWRHEQLSVAYTRIAAPDVEDPELLLRLVGTSHGWGRAGFPHSGDELVHPEADDPLRVAARELFTAGAWEELIDATDRAHGPWACAYYEALLRAADCGVSKEGS